MTKKQCIKCGRMLDHSEFNKRKKSKDGLQYHCKKCESIYRKERNILLKLEAMTAFGGRCTHVDKNGVQCSKNSVDDLKDLDLVHPNGDGNIHRDLISGERTGYRFYRELKKRNWDTDGFDVKVMCKFHHGGLDNNCGKKHPYYKQGKFNDPVWLKKQYEIMSSYQIADLCGISVSTIRRRMIEFNIQRRKTMHRP